MHNYLCLLLFTYFMDLMAPSVAIASMPERAVVERDAAAGVAKDIAVPFSPAEHLKGRTCADGRDAATFRGEILEFWGSMECRYCGIREVIKAQQAHPEWCIVVRHRPANTYGESMKKALAYEALRHFSQTAANNFWDAVVPTSDLLPPPYAASLLRMSAEAAVQPDALAEILEGEAAQTVQKDMEQGQDIPSTPTFVLGGIRFPSCDFSADQLAPALELAKKARSGDAAAQREIIQVITRGRMNEAML